MKNIVLFLLISVIGFDFSGQSYYSPNLRGTEILDSLSIPYLPIYNRANNYGFSESYKSKFISTFGNRLNYVPTNEHLDLSFQSFISDKIFVSNEDKIYNMLFAYYENYVVGSARIPIKDTNYYAVWIVETYTKSNDSFSTILYFELKDGRFETIFENIDLVKEGNMKVRYQ